MIENKEGYKETMTWTRLPGLSRLKTRLSLVAVWVNSEPAQKGKEAPELSQTNQYMQEEGSQQVKRFREILTRGPQARARACLPRC